LAPAWAAKLRKFWKSMGMEHLSVGCSCDYETKDE
jgi:hypothetical protein